MEWMFANHIAAGIIAWIVTMVVCCIDYAIKLLKLKEEGYDIETKINFNNKKIEANSLKVFGMILWAIVAWPYEVVGFALYYDRKTQEKIRWIKGEGS